MNGRSDPDIINEAGELNLNREFIVLTNAAGAQEISQAYSRTLRNLRASRHSQPQTEEEKLSDSRRRIDRLRFGCTTVSTTFTVSIFDVLFRISSPLGEKLVLFAEVNAFMGFGLGALSAIGHEFYEDCRYNGNPLRGRETNCQKLLHFGGTILACSFNSVLSATAYVLINKTFDQVLPNNDHSVMSKHDILVLKTILSLVVTVGANAVINLVYADSIRNTVSSCLSSASRNLRNCGQSIWQKVSGRNQDAAPLLSREVEAPKP